MYPESKITGPEPNRWCNYHKVKGHHTNNFHKLKKDIKTLIQEAHLKSMLEEAHNKQGGGIELRGETYPKNPCP